MEILEHWNDINIAIDIQKSMEYLVPYLDDIARQPANSKKSEGKFQRHQAYLNWSKNNFTNWEEIIQVGTFYFEEESLEDFVLEICQVYEKRFSIPYITDVLVEKAVTKLIMIWNTVLMIELLQLHTQKQANRKRYTGEYGILSAYRIHRKKKTILQS